MSDIDDALAQLKVILAAVDASPQPAPTGAHVYPADWAAINTALQADELPLFTVEQVVNRPFQWRRKAHGRGIHGWEADIRLYLHRGHLTTHADVAAAAVKQTAWYKAVSTALFANQTLNSTAHTIGENRVPGTLFTSRTGHLPWSGGEWWGIGFALPIFQVHTQPMSA